MCVWSTSYPVARAGGGGVGTRPCWLALLACGGAYWPLALEPSAMTGMRTTAGIRTAAGIHLPEGKSRMQLLPMASSPDGLISARGGGGAIARYRRTIISPGLPGSQRTCGA